MPLLFVHRLPWDTWNVAHVALHDVSPEEVEEVCRMESVSSQTYKGRVRVVGPTASRRILTVILAPRNRGLYYPVTARPANIKERQRYNELKGGEVR